MAYQPAAHPCSSTATRQTVDAPIVESSRLTVNRFQKAGPSRAWTPDSRASGPGPSVKPAGFRQAPTHERLDAAPCANHNVVR